MKCIISETIVALCNSGLDFSSELCVEGLLGITLDGRDILLVNINEVIKSGVAGGKTSGANTSSRNVDSDTGNKQTLAEVATSTETAEKSKEQHGSTNNMFNLNHELSQNSRPSESSRNQTDYIENEITQVQVKTEPDDVVVISINDEEESDNISSNPKLECYPEMGFWKENSTNASTDSAHQSVSEVAPSHSYNAQDSRLNIHSSDQQCETMTILKVESTSTDTLRSMVQGYQENYLGTVTTPEPMTMCASASPVQVPRSAMSMHQHSLVRLHKAFYSLYIIPMHSNLTPILHNSSPQPCSLPIKKKSG